MPKRRWRTDGQGSDRIIVIAAAAAAADGNHFARGADLRFLAGDARLYVRGNPPTAKPQMRLAG
jgi:hypothetical protein